MESMEGESGVSRPAAPNPSQRRYVVGFLFAESGDWVLMVEKRRPAWQKGRLNGISGRVEPGETAEAAMRREAIEEANIDPDWSEYVVVEYGEHVLHFFAARDEAAYMDARAGTDEQLVRMPTHWASLADRVIPNLTWLIPMARHHLFYEKVTLGHVIMHGSGETISRKQ